MAREIMPERMTAATYESLSTTELKQDQSKDKAKRLSPSWSMHMPQHRTAVLKQALALETEHP
jgi:hypothetical protein